MLRIEAFGSLLCSRSVLWRVLSLRGHLEGPLPEIRVCPYTFTRHFHLWPADEPRTISRSERADTDERAS